MDTALWIIIIIVFIAVVALVIWLVITLTKPATNGGGNGNQTTSQRLSVKNNCDQTIWVQQQNLPNDPAVIKLETGQTHEYAVPDAGVAAVRLWPKLQCDSDGNNCLIGQSVDPCPSGGCQPPIDTKFEATFAPLNSNTATSYDVSLVDGYTLPISVTPVGTGVNQGTCTTVNCGNLDLTQCPTADDLSGGMPQFSQYSSENLQVTDPNDPNTLIGCISPCKKLNFPAPWGLGLPESQDPTLHMCCPTPAGVSPCTWSNSCATPACCSDSSDPLSVVNTQYVKTVSSMCPNAYSYTYDDFSGTPVNLSCPANVKYEVIFCPTNNNNSSSNS